MDRSRTSHHLGEALEGLALALEDLELGGSRRDLLTERERLVTTIRHYLIPRAEDPSGPLVVVFAGPTGSGKSTLINSVVGSKVSESGILRPTTRTPIVIAASQGAERFSRVGAVECEVVARDAPILDRLVLVDTPDIDSTETEHRVIAENLVDNADVVVFVTSALRYADAVPWQVLRRAASKGTDVIQVLNRVGSSTRGSAVDFSARLRKEGLDDRILIVPEYHRPPDRLLPLIAVGDLRQLLADVALAHVVDAASIVDRVLGTTMQQLDVFVEKVESTREARAEFDADLKARLLQRSSALNLAGLTEGLYQPLPPDARSGHLRRWRRNNRRDEAEAERGLQDVVRELVTRVEVDLRGWLAEARSAMGVDGSFGIMSLRPLIVEATQGWIEYVRRIGESAEEKDRWLSVVSLIDAATREEPTPAVRAMHGDQGTVEAERAARELRNRLEVVYERAASLITDAVLGVPPDLSEAGVRKALGSLADVASPAYA